jgi:hypothetical protein
VALLVILLWGYRGDGIDAAAVRFGASGG